MNEIKIVLKIVASVLITFIIIAYAFLADAICSSSHNIPNETRHSYDFSSKIGFVVGPILIFLIWKDWTKKKERVGESK